CPLRRHRFNEAAANRRGKQLPPPIRQRAVSGFNEAAANRRGKRSSARAPAARTSASMRPRQIAAENNEKSLAWIPTPFASMRPRQIAAENHGIRRAGVAELVASMRPRQIAAENAPRGQQQAGDR